MLLRLETVVTERGRGSKVYAKFRTVLLPWKLGESWAKCHSEFFVLEIGPISSILLAAAAPRGADITDQVKQRQSSAGRSN